MTAALSGLVDWIFEYYIFPGKLPVNSSKCFQLVLSVVALLRVQIHLTDGQNNYYGWWYNVQENLYPWQSSFFGLARYILISTNWLDTLWIKALLPHPPYYCRELNLISNSKTNRPSLAITFIILDPSIRYLMRFPTISAGCTISSSIASWTDVSVRVRGRWTAEPFFGGRVILRVASKTTSCQTVTKD